MGRSAGSSRGAAPRSLRGRTRPGRLARLDAIMAERERGLLERGDAAFADAVWVDVGLGDQPSTTLESAERFRRINPALRTIAVDIDPTRVARAAAFAAGGGANAVEFRRGGFDLSAAISGERARLVRAMNVLRSYSELDASAAQRQLAAALLPGGLLVEGTSSADGGLLCAHLIRRIESGVTREALLFASDFGRGFAPWQFRDWLPRDLRRHARPGEPLFGFFSSWTVAFEAARGSGVRDARALFANSVAILAGRLPGIVHEPRLLALGCVLWQPENGVPEPGRPSAR